MPGRIRGGRRNLDHQKEEKVVDNCGQENGQKDEENVAKDDIFSQASEKANNHERDGGRAERGSGKDINDDTSEKAPPKPLTRAMKEAPTDNEKQGEVGEDSPDGEMGNERRLEESNES